MIIPRSAVLGLAILAGSAHAHPLIFNQALKAAYAQYDTTMSLPRNPLLFESGATVNNCADYLSAKQSSTIDEGVNNRIVAQGYLLCDSLALLKTAEAAAAPVNAAHLQGQALLHRLDLRTFRSSLAPAVNEQSFVLARLKQARAKARGHAVVSDTADWLFQLEVVAEADLQHDGKPDWIVWLTDTAKQGNYSDHAVLVIDDARDTKRKWLGARRAP